LVRNGTHSLVIHTGHIQKNAFPDQSQRRAVCNASHQTTDFRQTTV